MRLYMKDYREAEKLQQEFLGVAIRKGKLNVAREIVNIKPPDFKKRVKEFEGFVFGEKPTRKRRKKKKRG